MQPYASREKPKSEPLRGQGLSIVPLRKWTIYFLLDGQASIKAPDNYQSNSELVWDCNWLSGTGQTETTKTPGILTRNETGKGTHKRILCQKNEGTVRFKQKPVMVGGRTTFTGHCHLKWHLSKWDVRKEPRKNKTATHILCECEAIAYLILRHLGQYLTEAENYNDAHISRILHFIRSVGLLKD
jgi:hypothetical protein